MRVKWKQEETKRYNGLLRCMWKHNKHTCFVAYKTSHHAKVVKRYGYIQYVSQLFYRMGQCLEITRNEMIEAFKPIYAQLMYIVPMFQCNKRLFVSLTQIQKVLLCYSSISYSCVYDDVDVSVHTTTCLGCCVDMISGLR